MKFEASFRQPFTIEAILGFSPHDAHPMNELKLQLKRSFDDDIDDSYQLNECAPIDYKMTAITSKTRIPLTDCNNGGGKSKRVRTIFTPEQLDCLEKEFSRQQYMVGPERSYLASCLSLTEAQVKVWFQNRRIKHRKQHLDLQRTTQVAI